MLAIPVKKSRGLLLLALVVIFVAYSGYVYTLVRSVDEQVLVVVSLGIEPIQRRLARHELFRRIRASDADGVDALYTSLSLALEDDIDTELATAMARDLLAIGVDINGSTAMGFPPLHRAVNTIEPDVVAFLIEHCADPHKPVSLGSGDGSKEMNALELAYFMEREFPHLDYSRVVEVLERSDSGAQCENR